MLRILTNHIGYESNATKRAVFHGDGKIHPAGFEILDAKTEESVFLGTPEEVGEVDRWGTGYYYVMRFDELREEGQYYILVYTDDAEEFRSYPFEIGKNLLEMKTLSSAAYYFKCQRATGELEEADRNLPFAEPREGRVDVHGGWLDATGDFGIHLSQFMHTSYFNTQHVGLSTYIFFRACDLLEETRYPHYTFLKRRMLDEGIYGAEFLMRMRAPSGSFFTTKSRGKNAFDPPSRARKLQYAHRRVQRKEIPRVGFATFNAFEAIENTVTDEMYECSMRAGGGYAIAALAYAARINYPSRYTHAEYLNAAIDAYDYLYANNARYTNDGVWNLLDEYCALAALIEIYKTTREYDYLRRARDMAARIEARYIPVDESMGYLAVNEEARPFFHTTDTGIPCINLLDYCDIEPDEDLRAKAQDIAERVMRYELHITGEVANPFGYARQLVEHADGSRVTQFFYPHDCETAPWWLGENSRLASLATAARSLAKHTADPALAAALRGYADDQINWILGLNPFDSCMMEGYGRNLPVYFYEGHRDFFQTPGGIVNGVTSGTEDEHGIAYIMEPSEEISDNWRWGEQWIPHVSWYIYALAMSGNDGK